MPSIKKILTKIPKCSKRSSPAGVIIFATGNIAAALNVENFSSVYANSLTDSQISNLTRLFKL